MSSVFDSSSDDQLQGSIAALWIYPVKSCAGISVSEAVVTPTGLAWDRSWMVVDGQGEFLTQRELPAMALIQPRLTADALELSAPGMPMLSVPLAVDGQAMSVRVWDDQVVARDVGDEASSWFSTFLGGQAPTDLQHLRLVRFDPAVHRQCSLKWTGGRDSTTQFADGFGVLVSSTASIAKFNERLAGAGHSPVDIVRFRPNIVLDGVSAFDEDRMGAWQVRSAQGLVTLENVKPCARCPIPNIDPRTAETSPEVGDTLQTFRQDRRLGGAVTFGMNAIVLEGSGAVLRVGDPFSGEWVFD